MNRKKTLAERYNEIIWKYIDLFSKKQELDFDGWVGDTTGGIAMFADYYFDFEEIRYDIDTNQEAGLIIRYHEESVEFAIENDISTEINYKSYAAGLRFDQIDDLRKKNEEELCNRVIAARIYFQSALDNYKERYPATADEIRPHQQDYQQ